MTKMQFCKACGKEFSSKKEQEVCKDCLQTDLGKNIQGIAIEYERGVNREETSIWGIMGSVMFIVMIIWFVIPK